MIAKKSNLFRILYQIQAVQLETNTRCCGFQSAQAFLLLYIWLLRVFST